MKGDSGRRHRKRILAVIPSLARGGAERVLGLLTMEWSKRYEVTVVVFDTSEIAYQYGGRLLGLDLSAPRNAPRKLWVGMAASARLIRVCRRQQPDQIISFMEPANFPVVAAATLSGMRKRVTVSVRHNPGALPIARRLLIPWCYRLVGKVIAPSRGIADDLIRRGLPKKLVFAIPNPVFRGEDRRGASERPLSRPFVLGAGRLHRDKGFDRLLKAFSQVERPALELVIVGDGDERASLASLSHALGLGKRAHFPGAVDDVERWYQHAECFVLSSRVEGWPNVIMEAMANGCPVISFRCEYGPSEIIDNMHNGILVRDGDTDMLGAAIAAVVDDDELKRKLAEAGRRRAQMFHLAAIAEQWIDGG